MPVCAAAWAVPAARPDREIAGLTHRGEDCEERGKGQEQLGGGDVRRAKMGAIS